MIPQESFFGDMQVDEYLEGFSREEMEKTLIALNIHGRIPKLSQTVRSLNFSQGEQQLLNLARSLAKRAKVLLIDEGTASLDPESASIFVKSLTALDGFATRISIAHQIETI